MRLALDPTAAPAPPAQRRVTVWFDGDCPLCVREIALFRRLDRRGAIAFVEVAGDGSCPLDRETLLARFHAQEAGGTIVSGAAAFAAGAGTADLAAEARTMGWSGEEGGDTS